MAAESEEGDRTSNVLRPRMSSTSPLAAGDPLPTNCELIEVHVSELKQLFNAIDPSPFRERDLEPNAEEFITDWAKEASPSATFGLAVHLDRPAGLPNEPGELREAIHGFFRHRAELSRRRLRELLRRGRTSLVIGVCALGLSLAAGNLVGRFFSNHIAEILQEGLLIGGWVAMWRPMEIFLYDWWPIRAEAALADKLSVMPVRISYKQDGSADAWRWDWPVAPSAARAVHSKPIESPKADRL
jgi:hypothetical protein